MTNLDVQHRLGIYLYTKSFLCYDSCSFFCFEYGHYVMFRSILFVGTVVMDAVKVNLSLLFLFVCSITDV